MDFIVNMIADTVGVPYGNNEDLYVSPSAKKRPRLNCQQCGRSCYMHILLYIDDACVEANYQGSIMGVCGEKCMNKITKSRCVYFDPNKHRQRFLNNLKTSNSVIATALMAKQSDIFGGLLSDKTL